jgi:hypothetical protein
MPTADLLQPAQLNSFNVHQLQYIGKNDQLDFYDQAVMYVFFFVLIQLDHFLILLQSRRHIARAVGLRRPPDVQLCHIHSGHRQLHDVQGRKALPHSRRLAPSKEAAARLRRALGRHGQLKCPVAPPAADPAPAGRQRQRCRHRQGLPPLHLHLVQRGPVPPRLPARVSAHTLREPRPTCPISALSCSPAAKLRAQ